MRTQFGNGMDIADADAIWPRHERDGGGVRGAPTVEGWCESVSVLARHLPSTRLAEARGCERQKRKGVMNPSRGGGSARARTMRDAHDV